MQISLRLGLAFSRGISYNDNCFRDVAQVVERYFREVEAAGSSPVIPIVLLQRNADKYGIPFCMPQIPLGRIAKHKISSFTVHT